MKRSEINSAIEYAIEKFKENKIALPPFAYWKPEQWRKMAGGARRIILAGMGWDVTDLGRGKFKEIGAVLFTVRNGVPGAGNQGVSTGVPYCEKYIVLMDVSPHALVENGRHHQQGRRRADDGAVQLDRG